MATMEADARREDSEVAVRVAALRRKLASLEKQKPRILDLYKREIIPVEELEVERRKIDEDIASAKAAIEALGDDPDEATREEVLRDIIGGVVDVGDILAAIRQRDIGALAAALRATGSTVFVNINKGRCAPIDVTGMELRVGDMSRAQPDTPTVRAQQ
jgi:hypothetical protein